MNKAQHEYIRQRWAARRRWIAGSPEYLMYEVDAMTWVTRPTTATERKFFEDGTVPDWKVCQKEDEGWTKDARRMAENALKEPRAQMAASVH